MNMVYFTNSVNILIYKCYIFCTLFIVGKIKALPYFYGGLSVVHLQRVSVTTLQIYLTLLSSSIHLQNSSPINDMEDFPSGD